MKKTIHILLIISLLLTLAACAPKQPAQDAPLPDAAETADALDLSSLHRDLFTDLMTKKTWNSTLRLRCGRNNIRLAQSVL